MSQPPRKKRAGRELALLAAYAGDAVGDWSAAEAVLAGEPTECPVDAAHFAELRGVKGGLAQARRLLDAYLADRAAVDARIEDASQRWRLHRMDRVDRNVLRLAVAEHRLDPRLPRAVLMSEWVELAGRYGSERSGPFVNGVLRTLVAGDPGGAGAGRQRRGG